MVVVCCRPLCCQKAGQSCKHLGAGQRACGALFLCVQVVSCKDDLAQQYLMQCIIQGFPDAFHLGTLDALLGALPELQPGVRLHAVMASLMDRLAR